MKIKKSPDKSRNRGSNRNNIIVISRKQNDDKCSQKSFKSDQDEVRDKETLEDIVNTGDSMIKYINDREISRSSSVKIRSDLCATTENLIDKVRSIARKNNKNDGYSLWYQ